MPELDIEAIQSHGAPRPIRLCGKESATTGTVFIQKFTEGERLWRGAKVGIALLVVTALSVLVPLLHFILPPILLVVTVVVTAMTVGPRSVILGGTGTCPYCGKEFRIFRRADRYPFSDVCEGCGREVRIESEEISPKS